MNLNDIIEIIDNACWDARDAYGHADNGLTDWDTGEDLDIHPEAFVAARKIWNGVEEL